MTLYTFTWAYEARGGVISQTAVDVPAALSKVRATLSERLKVDPHKISFPLVTWADRRQISLDGDKMPTPLVEARQTLYALLQEVARDVPNWGPTPSPSALLEAIERLIDAKLAERFQDQR